MRGHLARHKLAVLYLESGRLAEAEAEWRRVTAEEPAYAVAWQGLAELFLRQGRWDELEQTTQRLQTLDPATAARLRARATDAKAPGRGD